MTTAYRITHGDRAFQVERLAHIGKEGEVWRILAYFRSRVAVVRFLARSRLPAWLADDLPDYHGDVARAVLAYMLADGARGEAAKAKGDRSRERCVARAVVRQEAQAA